MSIDLFGKKKQKELEEQIETLNDQFNHIQSENVQLEEKIEQKEEDIETLENEKETLQNEVESLKKSLVSESEEDSAYIMFEVSDDLIVRTKTRIDYKLSDILINYSYINPDQGDDEYAHHIALILIANEVTNEFIEQFEDARQG